MLPCSAGVFPSHPLIGLRGGSVFHVGHVLQDVETATVTFIVTQFCHLRAYLEHRFPVPDFFWLLHFQTADARAAAACPLGSGCVQGVGWQA